MLLLRINRLFSFTNVSNFITISNFKCLVKNPKVVLIFFILFWMRNINSLTPKYLKKIMPTKKMYGKHICWKFQGLTIIFLFFHQNQFFCKIVLRMNFHIPIFKFFSIIKISTEYLLLTLFILDSTIQPNLVNWLPASITVINVKG